MSAPELGTERLLLDSVTGDDTDAVLEYCQDAVLQRFVPVPTPYTRDAAEAYTVGYAAKAQYLWAIRDSRTRRFLGVVELSPEPVRSAELGYWLGSPARERGVMTEAVAAVLEYAFGSDGLGLGRVSWNAVVGNYPSAHVARKSGFRYEGLRRRALVQRDRRADAWFASLLADDERTQQDGWPL